MKEVWKKIRGYKNYQASSLGRIKNCKTNKILKSVKHHSERYIVCLHKDKKQYTELIHRLVYEAFYGKIPFWMEINHMDENPANNNKNNLMVCTKSQNINWGTRNKRCSEKMINRKDQSKILLQFDKDGNFIKEWPSTKEIERQLGFDRRNIYKCCNNKGRCKSAYGYIWKYKVIEEWEFSNN